MNAREAILDTLGATAMQDAGARRAEATALLERVERPPLPDAPLDDIFLERLAQPSVGATVERIATIDLLPTAVLAYLSTQALPASLYLPPDPWLSPLDWSGVERIGRVPDDGGAALAIATCAVAETGSLVVDTSPAAPMLPNFLALHHLVLVERAGLVRWLEDVPLPPFPGPRQRTWITGVSGTTDIEGQYVRGAHGPRFLHVILLG